ncbi:hypothetical protein Esti_004997 [Eimeria stiedai]
MRTSQLQHPSRRAPQEARSPVIKQEAAAAGKGGDVVGGSPPPPEGLGGGPPPPCASEGTCSTSQQQSAAPHALTAETHDVWELRLDRVEGGASKQGSETEPGGPSRGPPQGGPPADSSSHTWKTIAAISNPHNAEASPDVLKGGGSEEASWDLIVPPRRPLGAFEGLPSVGPQEGGLPSGKGAPHNAPSGFLTGSAYVRMQPSKDLPVSSSSCDESFHACKTLAQCLALRDAWQEPFPVRPSATVVAAAPPAADAAAADAAAAAAHEEGPPLAAASTDRVAPQNARPVEPLFKPQNVQPPADCHAVCRMQDGVFQVYFDPNRNEPPSAEYSPPLLGSPVPSVTQFLASLKEIMTAVQDPACKSFCYRRLRYLEKKFVLHLMFNNAAELEETRSNQHRDFYNVRKVDTHVHHAAAMNQKHLLNFIRRKYKEEGDTVVYVDDAGKRLSLRDVFSAMGLDASAASVDFLGVHALGSCFQRFDLFNQKYNPFGQRALRDVFLKTDNLVKGRFLAELTREMIKDLEDRRYQHVEWRLSIYGSSQGEWDRLASWVVDNNLISVRVRWLIQVPRLYYVYRARGQVSSFGEMLRNIFQPLFEAVCKPRQHPKLFAFLHQASEAQLRVVGWDSVDDESRVSKYTMEGGELPSPEEWTSTDNPPYSYWGYYMHANIKALNRLMFLQGMRSLDFRPHCGEAGSVSHLATMFLLAKGVNHGILLKKSPVLQYLFYLQQIGLAMSPLSNNALFLEVAKNPLYLFFKIGLNVSLSTDDPLMFHFTDEPLLEEYSLAAHYWKLSPVDLCELARNSVLQSGFEDEFKAHWLGPHFCLPGRRGNCMRQSNVSNIRLQYREDTLRDELSYMHDVLALRLAFPDGALNLAAAEGIVSYQGASTAAQQQQQQHEEEPPAEDAPSSNGDHQAVEAAAATEAAAAKALLLQVAREVSEAGGQRSSKPGDDANSSGTIPPLLQKGHREPAGAAAAAAAASAAAPAAVGVATIALTAASDIRYVASAFPRLRFVIRRALRSDTARAPQYLWDVTETAAIRSLDWQGSSISSSSR